MTIVATAQPIKTFGDLKAQLDRLEQGREDVPAIYNDTELVFSLGDLEEQKFLSICNSGVAQKRSKSTGEATMIVYIELERGMDTHTAKLQALLASFNA